jgi:hypothetical protein
VSLALLPPHPEGDWVLWSDVAKLLAAQPAAGEGKDE